MSGENALPGLHARYKALEDQLTAMQALHESLITKHGQQCITSLESAMTSLLDVIVCVRKADKRLITWHHRSKILKGALRRVGMDRRTETVIEKKTAKLKLKVAVAEDDFGNVKEIVSETLCETEKLKSKFVHFYRHSVDEVSKDTLVVHDTLDTSQDSIRTRIDEQQIEKLAAKKKWSREIEAMEAAKKEHSRAVATRDVLAAGSLVGLGVAAFAAVTCPVSLLFTGSALAAAGTGAMACAANDDVKVLGAKYEAVAAVLAEYDATLEALSRELRSLQQRRGECARAIKQVEALQAKAGCFRQVVQANLDYIRGTKLALDRTSLKLREIIQKLQECQFEETRRGIGDRLREVLATIEAVPSKKSITIKKEEVEKAMVYLADIDNKTAEVMLITKSVVA